MRQSTFDKKTKEMQGFVTANESIEIYKQEIIRSHKTLRFAFAIMGIIIITLILLLR